MPVRMTQKDVAVPLILDTNVVLDWLVFRHPCGVGLERALRSGTWQWAVTREMHQELDHVLGRGHLDGWQPDRAAIEVARATYASLVQPSALGLARLRCSDPDDQKFIDLALQLASSTLLSSDRALLKLARRARAAGVSIMTPAEWLRGEPPAG